MKRQFDASFRDAESDSFILITNQDTMKFKIVFGLFFCISFYSYSQETLTLTQAVETALSENLNIAVAKIDQETAEKAVYRSNAGFGPFLTLNAAANGTVNRVNQNFIDGRELRRLGRIIAPNVNLTLDWNLYDGGRMQATLDRLQELASTADVETRLQMQDIATQVMASYYEVVRQKERGAFLSTIIKYYEDRLRITEERWQVGRGSKLDYLQSKTDLNAQLAEQAAALNDLQNAKVQLNGLLNRSPDQEFTVAEVPVTENSYDLNGLLTLVKEKNLDLLLLQQLRKVNLLMEKEIEADRKVQIGLRSSLGYSYLNTNAGFLLSNQNASLTAGLSARLNIFDGQHLKNQLAIAQLQTKRVDLAYDQILQDITTRITMAHHQFVTDQELLAFEQENLNLAEENLSISVEKFRLGDSSILEVNEAQRTYDTAVNRLVNAQYNAKISELLLLELSGQLVSS